MVAYHDDEWGIPCWDDRRLFEMLVLESAQAGLSWRTILHKREGYRRNFCDFDPVHVAEFADADVERMLLDPGIVRNRAKIQATIGNARAFLALAARHGSFAAFQWRYTDGVPLVNHWVSQDQLPATSAISDRLAADLKQAGMKFMGSTVVYAHLQACGQIDDHLVSCFRRQA